MKGVVFSLLMFIKMEKRKRRWGVNEDRSEKREGNKCNKGENRRRRRGRQREMEMRKKEKTCNESDKRGKQRQQRREGD